MQPQERPIFPLVFRVHYTEEDHVLVPVNVHLTHLPPLNSQTEKATLIGKLTSGILNKKAIEALKHCPRAR